MNLNLVAQLSKLFVYVSLLGTRLLAWLLELDEERATARQPEDPVWVPSVARCHEL